MRRKERKMRKGPIVDLPGIPKVEVKINSGLVEFFKKIWGRITLAGLDNNKSKVNMCSKCGDIQIDGKWLKIPHPQKPIISDAVKSRGIIINGCLERCDFCRLVKRENKKRLKNLWKDSSSCIDFEQITPLSSMSF